MVNKYNLIIQNPICWDYIYLTVKELGINLKLIKNILEDISIHSLKNLKGIQSKYHHFKYNHLDKYLILYNYYKIQLLIFDKLLLMYELKKQDIKTFHMDKFLEQYFLLVRNILLDKCIFFQYFQVNNNLLVILLYFPIVIYILNLKGIDKVIPPVNLKIMSTKQVLFLIINNIQPVKLFNLLIL